MAGWGAGNVWEIPGFAIPASIFTSYVAKALLKKVQVEMLSGTICVILERTHVFFPVLSPGLIRLEFVTHRTDFKSYTLYMENDNSLPSNLSFSLFLHVYCPADWFRYGGRDGDGRVAYSCSFLFHHSMATVLPGYFPSRVPSLLF